MSSLRAVGRSEGGFLDGLRFDQGRWTAGWKTPTCGLQMLSRSRDGVIAGMVQPFTGGIVVFGRTTPSRLEGRERNAAGLLPFRVTCNSGCQHVAMSWSQGGGEILVTETPTLLPPTSDISQRSEKIFIHAFTHSRSVRHQRQSWCGKSRTQGTGQQDAGKRQPPRHPDGLWVVWKPGMSKGPGLSVERCGRRVQNASRFSATQRRRPGIEAPDPRAEMVPVSISEDPDITRASYSHQQFVATSKNERKKKKRDEEGGAALNSPRA
ncbi:hypothetical protein B0J11DRAFT_501343 [Dendryphion nanum]|uniref:Uncharacterized protein n=1 Tax=Dendryphion nanum TaxID=256645 RepID=A0A9P9ELE9_9PLEO|nr:hypothetical protein B0J11DRAFT_501343 [Dendryphion nanum]